MRLKITWSEKLYSLELFFCNSRRARIKRYLLVLLIVDICRNICLSLWTLAEKVKIRHRSSLFLARRGACASALDTTKNKTKQKNPSRNLNSAPSGPSNDCEKQGAEMVPWGTSELTDYCRTFVESYPTLIDFLSAWDKKI